MKKSILILFLSMATSWAMGQVQNPVSWEYEARKKNASTYEVFVTAKLDKPWHLYSQNTGKGGPIPTKISFKKNPLVTITPGKAKEMGKLEKHYDENFQTDVLYYSDKVQFVQIVKVKPGIKTNISGTVEYMVCDEERCLPPTKKTFDLKLQ